MDYLSTNVTPDEFAELKRQETAILDLVFSGFNEHWRPRVQGIQATFKYNPSRKVIGVYLGGELNPQLAMKNETLTQEQNAVVLSLHLALEQRLREIRLPKEKWVDSISE